MKARVSRYAPLILFVFVVGPEDSLAQRFNCYPIRTGETVARVAHRLTGDAVNRRASWFQVVDRRWRVVPKRNYDVVYPGWHACLAEPRPLMPSSLSEGTPIVSPAAEEPAAPPGRASGVSSWWWLAILASATLPTWVLTVRYRNKRRTTTDVMESFGRAFVGEFKRPLTQYRGGGPPLDARLRMVPRRAQLEIWLAPRAGQTYPNLSDHRSNVEYDVARVMAVLRCHFVAVGRTFASGKWVVVTFQFGRRLE